MTSEIHPGEPDPRVTLLLALEPFLTPEQKRRLPTAVKLVGFLKGEDDDGGIQ